MPRAQEHDRRREVRELASDSVEARLDELESRDRVAFRGVDAIDGPLRASDARLRLRDHVADGPCGFRGGGQESGLRGEKTALRRVFARKNMSEVGVQEIVVAQ